MKKVSNNFSKEYPAYSDISKKTRILVVVLISFLVIAFLSLKLGDSRTPFLVLALWFILLGITAIWSKFFILSKTNALEEEMKIAGNKLKNNSKSKIVLAAVDLNSFRRNLNTPFVRKFNSVILFAGGVIVMIMGLWIIYYILIGKL